MTLKAQATKPKPGQWDCTTFSESLCRAEGQAGTREGALWEKCVLSRLSTKRVKIQRGKELSGLESNATANPPLVPQVIQCIQCAVVKIATVSDLTVPIPQKWGRGCSELPRAIPGWDQGTLTL
jgi:hypothetical protein